MRRDHASFDKLAQACWRTKHSRVRSSLQLILICDEFAGLSLPSTLPIGILAQRFYLAHIVHQAEEEKVVHRLPFVGDDLEDLVS